MAFNEFQFSAGSAHYCSAHFVSRVPAEPGNVVVSSQLACAAAGGGEGFPAPQKDRPTRMGWGSKCSQKRVWTVSTPWASDSVVPASDWGRITDVFGGVADLQGRGWFESHLGHVFSLFRGFLASECGQIVL
jgi:hypothetical protein